MTSIAWCADLNHACVGQSFEKRLGNGFHIGGRIQPMRARMPLAPRANEPTVEHRNDIRILFQDWRKLIDMLQNDIERSIGLHAKIVGKAWNDFDSRFPKLGQTVSEARQIRRRDRCISVIIQPNIGTSERIPLLSDIFIIGFWLRKLDVSVKSALRIQKRRIRIDFVALVKGVRWSVRGNIAVAGFLVRC